MMRPCPKLSDWRTGAWVHHDGLAFARLFSRPAPLRASALRTASRNLRQALGSLSHSLAPWTRVMLFLPRRRPYPATPLLASTARRVASMPSAARAFFKVSRSHHGDHPTRATLAPGRRRRGLFAPCARVRPEPFPGRLASTDLLPTHQSPVRLDTMIWGRQLRHRNDSETRCVVLRARRCASAARHPRACRPISKCSARRILCADPALDRERMS